MSGKLLAAMQIELLFWRESHQRKEAKTLLCCSSNKVQYSKLQTLLDQEITEPLEDVSKIEEDLVASCELSSTIHECIVDLETALAAEEAQRESHRSSS